MILHRFAKGSVATLLTLFVGATHSVSAEGDDGSAARAEDGIGAVWYSAIADASDTASDGNSIEATPRERARPSATSTPGAGANPRGSRGIPNPNLPQTLEQVVTTARRRAEAAQRAPVAVTPLAERDLEARQVRRLDDLDARVPGLSIDRTLGNSNSAGIAIRGVGEGDPNPAVDPAVGVYVDGVYLPRAQGLNLPLYDVERVEVIRGPQGTLFGKNTIGGAVNVITRAPEFTLGGEASVRVGNFDRVDTRASIQLPLIAERAAARFSIASNYDDGYQQNAFLDERLGNDRLLAGRGQLLLLPTEDLELLLSAEYIRQDRRPIGGKCKVVGPVSPAVQGLIGIANAQRTAGGLAPIDLEATCRDDDQRSDFKVSSDLTFTEDDLRTTAFAARATWSLSPIATLRSITSFRMQDLDLRQDNDASPLPLAQPIVDAGGSDQRTFSQELQLNSSGFDGRLDMLVGLYAFTEAVDDQLIGGVFSGVLPNILPVTEEQLDVDNRSYSAYGSLTFAVTDRLSVSAGLRRTVERKRVSKSEVTLTPSIDLATGGVLPAGTPLLPTGFERSKRFDDFSPSASISFAATPDVLLYASYSTGFRSGGFNGRVNSINRDFNDIDSEELTTYEVGFKSRTFDSRLSVNASIYYSVYEDIQRPIVTAAAGGIPSAIVRNAAEARLRGAELEINALPIPELRLEANLAAFRSRYTDFDLFGNEVVSGTSFASVEDAPLPGAPDFLMSFAASYQRDLGRFGLLTSRVQWTHRGEQANEVQDNRATRTSAFGLLDAQLRLLFADGRTEVALFGTNLLDRTYLLNGLNVSDSVGQAVRFLGPPRRYGIELRRSF